MIAIQQRFSQIDVKRNQQETKKVARKGKEPLLDLHNKIKIIMSSDETFDLWKELIIKYSQGGAAGRRRHSYLQNALEPKVDSTQGWNSELRVFQVAWQLRRGGS